MTYKLDTEARRVIKKFGSIVVQMFVYDQLNRVIATLDNTGTMTATFIYGSRANLPDYVLKGSTTYQIISNHLGSPIQVINSSTGVISEEIHYDVWGNITADTNPGFIPFGFSGCLYDHDTKLMHFAAREYDASIGRWLSKVQYYLRTGIRIFTGMFWRIR